MGVGDPAVKAFEGKITGFRVLQNIGRVHRYIPVTRSRMFIMVHRYAHRI